MDKYTFKKIQIIIKNKAKTKSVLLFIGNETTFLYNF
jgi:hypothetical protein